MIALTMNAGISLWWNKVGKWQALVVFINLATYFITFYVNSDNAAMSAFIASFIVLLIFSLFYRRRLAAFTPAFVAVFAAACTTAYYPFLALIGLGFWAVILFEFLILGDESRMSGVSKKILRLSYAAEVVIIFIPAIPSIMATT